MFLQIYAEDYTMSEVFQASWLQKLMKYLLFVSLLTCKFTHFNCQMCIIVNDNMSYRNLTSMNY